MKKSQKSKKENNKKKSEKLSLGGRSFRFYVTEIVLPCVLFLLTLGVIFYYIIFPSVGYLHSDCTDTILWAQASYETGEWISDAFDYAAILPFGGNLLMLIFMPFFGYSMTTHTLGMLLFAALLYFAAIFFCRSLKMSNLWCALFSFLLFFTLSLSDKTREIMWGHIIYYSLGVLFFLFGFGLLFRITDAQKAATAAAEKLTPMSAIGGKRGAILHCVLALFLLLCATNGAQSLLTLIIPILGACFVARILDGKKSAYLQRCVCSGVTLVISGVATVAGLILMKIIVGDVGSGYASAYSSYTDMSEWIDNLLMLPIHYFELLGVDVKLYDPIVSGQSILTMIRIFGGIALLLLPFALLVRSHKNNDENKKLLCYGHFLLCVLLIYAYVCGLLSTANWRLVPLLGSCVIVSAVALFDMVGDAKLATLRRVGVLLLALVISLGGIACVTIAKMPADYGRDNSLHRLTEKLISLDEKGILPNVGYATFWNCQAVTLLSDNEIKLRGVTTDARVEKRTYQQMYEWYDEEATKDGCYLVVSDYEKYQLLGYLAAEGADYVYTESFDGFTVYVYERNILN